MDEIILKLLEVIEELDQCDGPWIDKVNRVRELARQENREADLAEFLSWFDEVV